jgi:hypothetical protein
MRMFHLWLAVVLFAVSAEAAYALSYRLAVLDDGRCGRRCPKAIVGTGEISSKELEQFIAFLSGLGRSTPIPHDFAIDSKGGNLGGAMKLGLALRQIGVRAVAGTVVDGKIRKGFCGSACVFVLMGGETRSVAAGSVVAIHSPRRIELAGVPEDDSENGPEARQRIVKALTEYVRVMGIDPALITLAMSIPPESRRILTQAEIKRFRLSTSEASRRAPPRPLRLTPRKVPLK